MLRKASLIAGAVCGVLCASGVLAYGAEVKSSFEEERAEVLARYGGEQVEVCVATRDIETGETLNSSNMEKRLWLGELLPEGAVLSAAETEGRAVVTPIYSGEVVTERRFERSEGFVLQVPEGLSAICVPAKAVTAVGGSLVAGSLVDVYVTSDASTDLLSRGVLVLSTSTTVGRENGASESDVSWVTLAVDPGLVKEIIAASRKSELYFSLPSDEGVFADSGKEGSDESEEIDDSGPLESQSGDGIADGYSSSAQGGKSEGLL